MSTAYILILAVLAYIAYQLYQLNVAKSAEKEEREVEKGEQRLREMFPNLYQGTSRDNDDLKEFVRMNEGDDLSNYIYLERYKIINSMIEKEGNETRKKEMASRREEIVNELRHWQDLFDKAKDEKKISSWEISYLLWGYLHAVNDSFPQKHTDLNSYVKYSGFPGLATSV